MERYKSKFKEEKKSLKENKGRSFPGADHSITLLANAIEKLIYLEGSDYWQEADSYTWDAVGHDLAQAIILSLESDIIPRNSAIHRTILNAVKKYL